MSLARHGAGHDASVRALLSQVHPVFMLPPIAAALFGGVLAGSFDPSLAGIHAVAVFAAVYTAHVKDGYVDFHIRGEDDDHPLTVGGCRAALAGATILFFACTIALALLVDAAAALVTLPCWLIGYHHAPQLDTNPFTTTTGYPAGIAFALLGGFYVQATTVAPVTLAFAAVFLVLLSGVKVIDDMQDYEYDLSIEKRTVAVSLGPDRAMSLAYGLMLVALLLVLALAALGPFPPSSVLAALAFGVVAGFARRGDPEIATMLLVRGSYVFLAVLVAAVWWQPLV
ncbi:UbiA family prenyltransferase [Natronoarchaeum sp. GCM10025703]|uniref:UbiA family prenyltransferase n=1 Tax=unclassified Natronoarchaeum TaxID=2620183 RepID=UPI0036130D63